MTLKDKYFTILEAAKEFSVTRQTISRWITEDKIPTEKVGREILIKKKDFYEYYRRRLSKAAAKSIVDLYLATAEDYCREKGYIDANTPTRHVEFIDEHTEADIITQKFSDEEKAEIKERFSPILEGLLKDFPQKVGMKGNNPKDKQRRKTTK